MQTVLLASEESKDIRFRIKAMSKIISIAKHALNYNNFYTTFSIISGLNATSVQRLKKTWEGLSEKSKSEWQELENIADPGKNLKNYRDKISAAIPPIVPFLRNYILNQPFI